MAELNLPTTPSDGQEVTHENTKFVYSASKNVWTRQTLNTRFENVVPTTNTSLTSTAISGSNLVFTKADGSTSNVNLTAMASGQVRVFATEAALPTTSAELTAANIQPGEHALVTQTDNLYIYAGGWRKIDSVNLTPSVTASISSKSFTPAETIDITYTVNEPEGTPVTVTTSNTGISNTDQVSISHHTGNNTVTVTAGQSGLSGGILSINATDGTSIGSASITLDVNVGFDSGVFLQNQWTSTAAGDKARYGMNAVLSMDGKYLAISSQEFYNTPNSSGGHIDIWTSDGTTNSWTHQTTVDHIDFDNAHPSQTSDRPNNTFGRMGMQMNADGTRLLVADPYATIQGQISRGTMTILQRSGSTWTFCKGIQNPNHFIEPNQNPRAYMYAGESVCMGTGTGTNNGQCVVFGHDKGGTQRGPIFQIMKIDDSQGRIENRASNYQIIDFSTEPNNGWLVAQTRSNIARCAMTANSEWLAIGMGTSFTTATYNGVQYGDDQKHRGVVYFYKSSNINRKDFTQQQYIIGSLTTNNEGRFGDAVRMSDTDTCVITQQKGDHSSGVPGVGQVYVYKLSGNNWGQIQILEAPTTGLGSNIGTDSLSKYRRFGAALAISGDASYIAVMDTTFDNSIESVVHVYKKNGSNTYSLFDQLQADTGNTAHGGGANSSDARRITISNNGFLAYGAPSSDKISADHGQVQVFKA